MKKNILLLVVASALSLVSCGNEEIGTIDGGSPQTAQSDSADMQSADTATDIQSPTEYTSLSDGNEFVFSDIYQEGNDFTPQYSQYVGTDDIGGYVAGGSETETVSPYVAGGNEVQNSAVVEYGSSDAPVGSYASTHGASPNAPSPDDYNYGPAPMQYDWAGIKYIDGVLIANKTYSLPSDFNPGLDDTCYAQFEKLCSGASAEGLDIYLSSGFRSYEYQDEIYNNYVAYDGQENADRYSARPGHSEHQSGLAIDVNIIDDSFAGTPEANWLEAHCHEYGFILRYPKGKEDITGYKYESWHIRYVGTDMSYRIAESGLTLEEFFGIDSYYH